VTRRTPAGPISTPIDKVRLAIADSDAARAFLDVSDRLDALGRIHGQILPVKLNRDGEITRAALDELRPFIQVETPDGGVTLLRNSSSQTGQGFNLSVVVHATFEQATPAGFEGDNEGGDIDFANAVGQTMQQVFAMSGVYPYADINAAELSTAPFRGNAKRNPTLGDCFAAIVEFRIGQGSEGG